MERERDAMRSKHERQLASLEAELNHLEVGRERLRSDHRMHPNPSPKPETENRTSKTETKTETLK